jgi:CspA family cold shock protein
LVVPEFAGDSEPVAVRYSSLVGELKNHDRAENRGSSPIHGGNVEYTNITHRVFILGRQSRIAMAKGVVDFFNDTGGYGFIETDEADEDVFFHMEDVGGPDLEEGQEVEFEIEEAEKGPRAKNLERL